MSLITSAVFIRMAAVTQLTRRHFLRLSALSAAGCGSWPTGTSAASDRSEFAKAIEDLEPYLTSQESFRDVSRGKPLPHSLPEERKRKVGLTRDTWKLEIVSDPD